MDSSISRRQFAIIGAVAGVGAIGAFVGLRGGSNKLLKVEGDSALSPFMVSAVRGFRRMHPKAAIDVRSTTADAALTALRAGTIDVAMLARDLRPNERGLRAQRVAVDGVAMVVNAENRTLGMPPSAWQELFGGVKHDWPGFGGPAARVSLFVRADGNAARALIHEHLHIERVMAEAVVVDSDARLIERVRGDVGAIGYGSVAQIEAAIHAGAPLRMLPLDGNAPSTEAVVSGSYPLRINLSLVTAGDPSGTTRDLLAYVRSGTGQSLLRASGYTPAT